MTKICLLGDTHFGARGDNDILAAYMLRYYDEYFFPLLNELRIKTVVQAGDLLDRRKYTNHETLIYIRTKFIEIHIGIWYVSVKGILFRLEIIFP